MVVVRQDGISYAISFIAFCVNVYLFTWNVSALTLFPMALLLGSLEFHRRFAGKDADTGDLIVSQDRATGMMWYIGFGSLIMAVAAISSAGLWMVPGAIIEFSKLDITVFGIFSLLQLHGLLMAVSEEQFFRAALLEIAGRFPVRPLIILGEAAIGPAYHMMVYGTQGSALMYVSIVWAGLTWITLRSGTPTPAIIIHVINNLFAASFAGKIVAPAASILAALLRDPRVVSVVEPVLRASAQMMGIRLW